MEDKEFFEELVIENLEKFNVFDIHFIQAFRFFYETYDFELPKDYKTKLLTVLSDVNKIENDMKVKRNNLKGLEIEQISNYLGNLRRFITEDFTLGNVFCIDEKAAIEEYEEIISKGTFEEDHDLVIFYIETAKHLLNYFSTKISVKIFNPFLEGLKANEDKRIDNISSNVTLEFDVVSFDLKYMEEDLTEIISDGYDE
ncbi:MAG: hypothetical protein J6Y42_00865 [Bacilli bacterium]|nr:hypothetical protein [Bacilli bacterium]